MVEAALDRRDPAAVERPRLEVHTGPGPQSVSLVSCDPILLAAAADLICSDGSLRSVLQVSVVCDSMPGDDLLPLIAGRYTVSGNAIRFTPHFPFQAGMRYHAFFDPRPLDCPDVLDQLTLDFFQPAECGPPAAVEHIFPSADVLPENLLRFYICFSQPMQRGQAGTEVSLLGPDGQVAPDALYRAPVELWDRSMRCLTVLLDPGRIKRGVRPNRELGPPLKAGQTYTLAIGVGMTASSGACLSRAVHKRFSVAAPVREPISAKDWEVVFPPAGSRKPMLLRFPRPLDSALLRQAITVVTESGVRVEGRAETMFLEQEAGFLPATPWAADPHRISIAADLEDVCGNRLGSAFEKSLSDHTVPAEVTSMLTLFFRPY